MKRKEAKKKIKSLIDFLPILNHKELAMGDQCSFFQSKNQTNSARNVDLNKVSPIIPFQVSSKEF